MLEIRLAYPQELDRVVEFYRQTEYGGGVSPTDQVVIAETAGELVGAYRLAREHGVLVLRGMRVCAGCRRRGVGTELLQFVSATEEPCYCIPHAYLQVFYSHAGFVTVSPQGAPRFLGERLIDYRQRGLDVVLMRRNGVGRCLTQYVASFAQRVAELFPRCPPGERQAIAEHACTIHSGRVGRSAAAKRLDAWAVDLAVRAHVRHEHTCYDELLGHGWSRDASREEVASVVARVLEAWR